MTVGRRPQQRFRGWILGCLLCQACGDQDESPATSIPVDWSPIRISCNLELVVPAGTREIPSMGEDSCVARIEMDGCTLDADRGAFSDPLDSYSDRPQYATKTVRVAGQAGRLIQFRDDEGGAAEPYVVGLHAPDPVTSGASITIVGRCTSAEAQSQAATMLGTLQVSP